MAEVFLTLPLALPDIKTNPPAPACTVVNIENTFYLDPPSAEAQTVDILGTPVTIYPAVENYTFTYGDGTSHTTTDPGEPYPDTTNTHTYTQAGTYSASVTVTWTGEWEAPGIPRGPIPGTAQTTSAPTTLYTHTYRTQLLDDPKSAPQRGTPLGPDDPCAG
ncbi:PKD domain-containing protein [Nakamurella flavida]|uniref:PKD domain-containing protein n=1 Tax=Nakamurella flavida TaxID=363630 RepID=A0A939C0S6_9ACTN|nr:PKD domain-containing protein [Nakamurella flavida]MBM9477028.1 PKD domain-containing protein [Nakamurella flavida]MDP9779973.1 hypothetical protein [Nakamurella flavida]